MREKYDKEDVARAELLGSLLLFTRYFYQKLNNRPFVMSRPDGRESHYITIARELTNLFYLRTKNLIINVPPGHGKSTMLCYFIAWAMAHYSDSQFLYISYSVSLATKHTATVRSIMMLPDYFSAFGVKIKSDSRAKDIFQTTANGQVAAFGGGGPVTGQDGGLPNLDRFSGGVFIDDIHKSKEVHSDTVRESDLMNYRETIKNRTRGPNVPICYIGQRLHEDDLPQFLIDGKDGLEWKKVILEGEDAAGNVLAPNLRDKYFYQKERELSPYVYWSQYQQNPIPAGGSLFNPDKFAMLQSDPEFLMTFITADTAETEKSYNDATAFSHWGLYYIEQVGLPTPLIGLHWIDCLETRVEPKDLEDTFMGFWQDCMRCEVSPMIAAIEAKSSGVTLLSLLQKIRGLRIMRIERNRQSGSKIDRFIACQRFINERLISFTEYSHHVSMCKTHMAKITANGAHKFDDICDTAADAIRLVYIDKTLQHLTSRSVKTDDMLTKMAAYNQRKADARKNLYGGKSRRSIYTVR